MAAISTFDQWQKDVFFSAAEEVQESADTMESMYRMWVHESSNGLEPGFLDELRKDLHTTLGTAKWQLEEFEKAVSLSHQCYPLEDNTITRHDGFIDAIRSKISNVERAIEDSLIEEGKQPLRWVQLDKEERDELEIFLSSAPCPSPEKKDRDNNANCECIRGFKETVTISKDAKYVVEVAQTEPFGSRDNLVAHTDYSGGQRKVGSSSEIGSWKIVIVDEEDEQKKLIKARSIFKQNECAAKLRWFRDIFRKAKSEEHHLPRLRFSNYLGLIGLGQGIHRLSEKSRSCYSRCKEVPKGYYIEQIGKGSGLDRHFHRSVLFNKHSLLAASLLVLIVFLIVPFVFYST